MDHETVSSLAIYVHVMSAPEAASYTWESDRPEYGIMGISAYSGIDKGFPRNRVRKNLAPMTCA